MNQSRKIQNLLFVGDTVPDQPFELGTALKELCGRHDLRIFNLEGAVSGFGKQLFKAGSYVRLDPNLLSSLAVCFNVAGMANNHVMDFGVEGLDTTLLCCRRACIATVGAGLNKQDALAPLDIGNCRIIAVAENEFGAASTNKAGIATVDRELDIYLAIRDGRCAGKFVVVMAHGGTEFLSVPPPYLRQRYKLWIEYGADLIIGSHPHIVQGYEFYKNKAIFYSLGNFMFFRESFRQYPNTDWSIAVSINTDTYDIQIIPVQIYENGLIEVASGSRYEEEMKRLCHLIRVDENGLLCQQAASDLYKQWYSRLAVSNEKDAALLLHYLRCDAHRHMIQTALSQKIGEIPNPGNTVPCDSDPKSCVVQGDSR